MSSAYIGKGTGTLRDFLDEHPHLLDTTMLRWTMSITPGEEIDITSWSDCGLKNYICRPSTIDLSFTLGAKDHGITYFDRLRDPKLSGCEGSRGEEVLQTQQHPDSNDVRLVPGTLLLMGT